MSQITLDSHNVLGKLSIVKNYLSVVIADEEKKLTSKSVEYLRRAYETNQSLIDEIKKLNPKGLKSSTLRV